MVERIINIFGLDLFWEVSSKKDMFASIINIFGLSGARG
jgi:hypothetical protein